MPAPVLIDGRYEVLEPVGRGGMATVFRAKDTRLLREVAVKVLLNPIDAEEDGVFYFHREARALASLEHHNIVQIFDYSGPNESPAWLVMQLVKGGNLKHALIAKAPIPDRVILAVASGICDALAHAHEKGVIHRDLKPTNVMVDTNGRILLTDFGLAKAFEDDKKLGATLAGVKTALFGTPNFMSPEQLQFGKANPASDVFALGSLLYYLSTTVPPFQDTSAVASAKRLISVKYEPLENKRTDLSPHVIELVKACLVQDARERPSARELGEAIKAVPYDFSLPVAEDYVARFMSGSLEPGEADYAPGGEDAAVTGDTTWELTRSGESETSSRQDVRREKPEQKIVEKTEISFGIHDSHEPDTDTDAGGAPDFDPYATVLGRPKPREITATDIAPYPRETGPNSTDPDIVENTDTQIAPFKSGTTDSELEAEPSLAPAQPYSRPLPPPSAIPPTIINPVPQELLEDGPAPPYLHRADSPPTPTWLKEARRFYRGQLIPVLRVRFGRLFAWIRVNPIAAASAVGIIMLLFGIVLLLSDQRSERAPEWNRAAVAPATVQVKANAGARIFVDGEYTGDATKLDSLTLQPGKHVVEARHPTLGTKTQTVTLVAGESVTLELKHAARRRKKRR